MCRVCTEHWPAGNTSDQCGERRALQLKCQCPMLLGRPHRKVVQKTQDQIPGLPSPPAEPSSSPLTSTVVVAAPLAMVDGITAPQLPGPTTVQPHRRLPRMRIVLIPPWPSLSTRPGSWWALPGHPVLQLLLISPEITVE